MNGYSVALLTVVVTALPATLVQADDRGLELNPHERRIVLSLSPLDPERLLDPTNRWCGDERAAAFGARLFFDTRLSSDGDTSCATCHIPRRGWASGPRTAPAASGTRDTPTLTNVVYNRWFNWDGSADSLWSQCLGPMESPNELDATRVEVARRIQTLPELRQDYVALFGPIPASISPSRLPPRAKPMPHEPQHPLHQQWRKLDEGQRRAVNDLFVNVAKAIAAFEATIVSDDAPFDRFVAGLRAGDAEGMAALAPTARRGLRLFIGKARCVLCHSGPNLSDGEFHNVLAAAPGARDRGRYDGIARLRASAFNFDSPYNDAAPGEAFPWLHYLRRTPANKAQFKTPTLRNAALTAPYMHNGRYDTLEEVIDHYDNIDALRTPGDRAETLLRSLGLASAEKRDLLAFLRSLTDNVTLARRNGPQAWR